MKLLIALSGFLILYISYGLYISQADIVVFPPGLARENASGFYDYKGVINVHTDLSIGSSSTAQVVAAANAAGLNFLLMTDLNTFDGPRFADGYHDETLVLYGQKVSYLDSRLIWYSPSGHTLGDHLGEAQVKIADLLTQPVGRNADDLLILAHPYKSGFSWSGDLPTGLDGFEVLNAKSLSNRSWENSKLSTIWSLISYPFNPRLAFLRLFSEPTEEIELFDNLSRERDVVGFAGAEASARAIPLANYLIKFPSYQRSFEFLTNHVLLRSELTGNLASDRSKIFSALKKGSFYLCLELLGDPKGFNAWLDDRGRVLPIGSSAKFSKSLTLQVRLPAAPTSFYEVVVYRDGVRYETFNQTEVSFPLTEPGVYRVQVRVSPYLPLPDAKRWITWIYTNNFRVTP